MRDHPASFARSFNWAPALAALVAQEWPCLAGLSRASAEEEQASAEEEQASAEEEQASAEEEQASAEPQQSLAGLSRRGADLQAYCELLCTNASSGQGWHTYSNNWSTGSLVQLF